MKRNYFVRWVKKKLGESTDKIVGAMLSMAVIISLSGFWQNDDMADRVFELMDQGYTYEQAADQAVEEFQGVDGLNGTGGIDGQPIGGGSSTSNSTPSTTPTCSHEWAEHDNVTATCTKEGSITYKCLNCSATKQSKVAKTDHDFEVVELKEGTCTDTGYASYKCKNCDATDKVETSLGNHVFIPSEENVEATCTTDGLKKEVCSICGETAEEVVEALGHDFEKNVTVDKQATCMEDGLESNHCTRCDAVENETIISAVGHKESAEMVVVKQATFFTDGQANKVCEQCGEVLDSVTLDATGGVWRIITPVVLVLAAVAGIATAVVFGKKRK